ncbi:MAG: BMP family ABC transporter substrate-binding protein [Atribacterota bacterium]|mgnify:FL=1|uniref:BMP family lipoprotein n=1 Tax=Atribacter sp. TaxID=2847780 RepID=UPI003D956892|nr:BMP family ABC transporter substrate-binding protein [Atribacterota bacterium]
MKRVLSVSCIFFLLVLVLLSCNFNQEAWAASTKKIGLICATGGLGDKSFNDIAFAGATQAKEEFNVEFDYVEPKAVAEYEGYQRDFAMSQEYEIIICIGFDQADALNKIAAEYPDQKFALVDMAVEQPNVASLLFKANEGSFLLGVVAANMSQSKKIGMIGGMDIPLIRDFFVGFEAGVKWANTGAEVLPGVFVGNWADPTKGKELAISLIDSGADIIWPSAGKSGLGALEAVKERDVFGMGVDACQCYVNEKMLASMTKRVDIAVYETIKSAYDGTFQGGVLEKGVADGWVGMCRLSEEEEFWEEKYGFVHSVSFPQEVLDIVIEAQTKIKTGEIIVPRPTEFGG